MLLSVLFFSSAPRAADPYGLLLRAARLADELGYTAVWTPERHFDEFGGIFPNPAVTGAALAVVTRRVQIRAGSVIAPLHDILRVAEEWSVVDNLSGGRVALSLGCGWNANDFVLGPSRYEGRHELVWDQLTELRHLWRGGRVTRPNGCGRPVEVATQPRPVQAELPVWTTSSGSPATFARAGEQATSVLTHLMGQDLTTLAGNIARYREAYAGHHPQRPAGTVSLMLHTYVGREDEDVRSVVRRPMREYLRASVALEVEADLGGGSQSGGRRGPGQRPDPALVDELLDLTFERYYETASLLGPAAKVAGFLRELESIGVDEVACLVDFGLPDRDVLDGLVRLALLRDSLTGREARPVAVPATHGGIKDDS